MTGGVRKRESSRRLWPSGVRIMAISTRWPASPVTRPAHSPSIVARPSSSSPSSRKKSIVPSRSSTTIPTLSIRLSAMGPIYKVSFRATTHPSCDKFALEHLWPLRPQRPRAPASLAILMPQTIPHAKNACPAQSLSTIVNWSNEKKTGILNAIPPIRPNEADERTARHLRLCAELADLAMQLARAAAARSLVDWAEPEAAPTAEPQSTQAAEP